MTDKHISESAWKAIESMREDAQAAYTKAEKAQQAFIEARDVFEKEDEKITAYIKGVAAAMDVDLDCYRLEAGRFVYTPGACDSCADPEN